MNEVLKINYEAEQPTVSARELHEALGVASRFSRWFDSNKELFVEGEDYNKCTSSTVVNNGASHLRKQNPWYWNWGHCDLRKEGSKLTFFYNGSYPSFNIPEIADMKCAKIQIAIKQRGTRSGNKYLTYNGINAFYFQKLHVEKWRDVPNKFAQDCSLIANCSDGSIRMNGLPKPDLGALGNDWETFCLKPGVNQVQCLCSSWAKKPTFKMKYREVFL